MVTTDKHGERLGTLLTRGDGFVIHPTSRFLVLPGHLKFLLQFFFEFFFSKLFSKILKILVKFFWKILKIRSKFLDFFFFLKKAWNLCFSQTAAKFVNCWSSIGHAPGEFMIFRFQFDTWRPTSAYSLAWLSSGKISILEKLWKCYQLRLEDVYLLLSGAEFMVDSNFISSSFRYKSFWIK